MEKEPLYMALFNMSFVYCVCIVCVLQCEFLCVFLNLKCRQTLDITEFMVSVTP